MSDGEPLFKNRPQGNLNQEVYHSQVLEEVPGVPEGPHRKVEAGGRQQAAGPETHASIGAIGSVLGYPT